MAASPERFAFASNLTICRILNGMWQVSGAHGRIERGKALESMAAHVDAGFTTWDLADHYGPAEDFVGEFRRRHAAERGEPALDALQFFTKWVPRPGPMPRAVVEAAVATSRRRMAAETLDLLQFHWWDYADRRYFDALAHLAELRDAGVIRHIALTNFDTGRLAGILDHGIRIVSNQVQFSLIDRRPEVHMAPLCRERGVHLLAYGTVCGGLLSDRYLGQPEPRGSSLDTVSLQKYKRMVDVWGGWGLFQELLAALHDVAARHGVDIATVAVRWVLDRPAVAGAILGRRLGLSDHRAQNARVFAVQLDAGDHARIDAVLARSRDLLSAIGDCGDEYPLNVDEEIWMNADGTGIAGIVGALENAWNEADGAAFARHFAEDADFVNIRGEHFQTREAIAKGHQVIFNTIYKGSVVRYQVIASRPIAPGVLVAHVRTALTAPTGPLAGEHNSLFTIVLVQDRDDWRIAAFHNTLMT